MSEIANRPNPLAQYSVITTKTLTATTSLSGSALYVDSTTVNGGNFTGVGTITGSACKIMGTSGSINFADCFASGSGSLVSGACLKVSVTGSTYKIQLWA